MRTLLNILLILTTISTILLSLSTFYYYTKYESTLDSLKDLESTSNEQQETISSLNEQLSTQVTISVTATSGAFALLATLLALLHMSSHLRHFNQPNVQRKILSIILMSPIYSVTSWLSLSFPSAEGYLSLIKDCYEAYLIYQFLSFLIAVMGGRDNAIEKLADHSEHLTPPSLLVRSCCFPNFASNPIQLASSVLFECQLYAMQFVFLRPILSSLMLILEKSDYYGPFATQAWDVRAPQFYLVLVENISVFFAFMGLLKFYHAVHDYIKWIRPFPKFMCIKGIVFLTFWQGIVIAILVHSLNLQIASADEDIPEEDTATLLQNLLITCEMFLFAIAHYCYYPWEEWEEGYLQKINDNKATAVTKFGDQLALRDFAADVNMMIRTGKTNMKNRNARQQNFLTVDEYDACEKEDDNEVTDNNDNTII